MLGRIERIFVSHGFEAAGTRGSYLIFQCARSEVETTALLAESIEKSDLYLRNRKRRWSGYSVYVFFDDATEEKGLSLQQVAAEMYRLPEEDGIWLDERSARLLSDRFVIRKVNGLYRVITGDRKQRRELRSFDDFFAQLPLAETCFDRFAPLLQSAKPAAFHLRGGDSFCRERLTAFLLGSIDSSMRKIYWLELNPAKSGPGPAVMLLDAIDARFRSFVSDHLNPTERRVWKHLEGLLEVSPSDVRSGDGFNLFLLYLTAYVRYMRTLLLPALVVFHGMENAAREQWDWIADLCRRFARRDPFLPVFDSSEDLPAEAAADFTVREFDCSAASTETEAADAGEQTDEDRGGEAAAGEEGGQSPLDGFGLYLRYFRETMKPGKGFRSSKAAFRAFFATLPEEHVIVLYAISFFGTVFPAEYRRSLAGALGMEQEEMNLALRELVNYGMLEHGREIRLRFEGLAASLEEFLNEKRDFVKKACARILPELKGHVAAEKRKEFAVRAVALGREDTAGEVLAELLEENLFRSFDAGVLGRVEELLHSTAGGRRRLISSETLETVRLEALLREGEYDEARRRYRVLIRDEAMQSNGLLNSDPQRLAVAGEYLWRFRSPEEALPFAKKALLGVQDTGNLPRILQARILIGKVMLSLGRVDEALEYFRSAKGYTLEGPPAALDLESSAFIALTHFVLGDYSLSLGYIRPAREKAASMGRREWERYLLMLEGKLQFELGRYREASVLFQELLSGELLYFNGAGRELFEAWLYRSLIYRGYTDEGIRRLQRLEEGPESLLFTAEGYILDRDLESASILTGRAIVARSREVKGMLPSAEQLAPDGFASFENYLLQGEENNDLLLRHLKALHGFLAFNLGRDEEAEQEFDDVLGDKKALNLDPHRHLYYFFRTLSFSEHRAEEEVQKMTLLSKAWQNLQKRSGRINDPEDRRSYLTENYWNSKLFAMSKEYKLV